jgi:7-carboxy-7-deazaguanine synthase
MPKLYAINEVYLTTQGEGVRAGEPSVFLRFTGCNLRCAMEAGPRSPGGFDCDTEFESGRQLTRDEIVAWCLAEAGACRWIVMTGGEPALQVDDELCDALHAAGFTLAIETNGSIKVSDAIDWVTVSPKVAEHCIRQLTASEVKYVRGYGQAIPKTRVIAEHYFISPAFCGLHVDRQAMDWCQKLIEENPKWKLSIQTHKLQGIR